MGLTMKIVVVLATAMLSASCSLGSIGSGGQRDRDAGGLNAGTGTGSDGGPAAPVTRASANIQPVKAGVIVSGAAQFVQENGQLVITVMVINGPPGNHAVHIHEMGDCSGADGAATGAIFDPSMMQHGSPSSEMHKAGGLGNMLFGALGGSGMLTVRTSGLTVSKGSTAILDRAIVIHERLDNFVDEDDGKAGPAIGCGVIKAMPAKK